VTTPFHVTLSVLKHIVQGLHGENLGAKRQTHAWYDLLETQETEVQDVSCLDLLFVDFSFVPSVQARADELS